MPGRHPSAPPRGRWAAALAARRRATGFAAAQALPDHAFPAVHPAFVGFVCEAGDPPVVRTEAERARCEMRDREFLPAGERWRRQRRTRDLAQRTRSA